MSNTKIPETGGPAFPMPEREASAYASCMEDLGNGSLLASERTYLEAKVAALRGMTLRDYFAAKAMQGLISDQDWRQDTLPEDTAFAAYSMADAMLKAREE